MVLIMNFEVILSLIMIKLYFYHYLFFNCLTILNYFNSIHYIDEFCIIDLIIKFVWTYRIRF